MTQHTFFDLTSADVVSGLHSKIETAYVQTTNNTATTLWSVSVPEGSIITLFALMSGLRDDHSEGVGGTLVAALRRDVGGNVTVIGSVTAVVQDDSGGSPTYTVDADTSNQLARIRVTGETSKNINWLGTIVYQLASI